MIGHEAILREHKNNIFTDVVCGRGSSAALTCVITTNGLICQFDKDRRLRAHRNLEVLDDFHTNEINMKHEFFP